MKEYISDWGVRQLIDQEIRKNPILLQFLKENRVLTKYKSAQYDALIKCIKFPPKYINKLESLYRKKSNAYSVIHRHFNWIKHNPTYFSNDIELDITQTPSYWVKLGIKYEQYYKTLTNHG